VSPLELVDDRFEKLAEELRGAQPIAPPALRERVRALEPPPRRRLELDVPWRRIVPAVALAALAAGLGIAGVLGIVHGSSAPSLQAQKGTSPTHLRRQLLPNPGLQDKAAPAQPFSAGLSRTAGRLQQYDASLRVRVRDQEELSKRTQDALRLTRKLGGYLVWANYAAPSRSGNSNLSLKIPIEHVQAAIAAFSGYGTLVRQRIVLKDLQQRVDDLAARIKRLRERIAHGGNAQDRARLARLLRARSSTVKRAQMASVALTMVVGKKAAAAPASRFHRTVNDAGSVLVRELELLLYGLVVAGPLLAIGGAGIFASRSIRRRSDERLLERS
jgi:chaperonin cofactor prefoldin